MIHVYNSNYQEGMVWIYGVATYILIDVIHMFSFIAIAIAFC